MNILMGLILALGAYFAADALLKYRNRPKLEPIDKDSRPNSALLVIDMQEDFTRAKGKLSYDQVRVSAANAKINQLAEAARKAHMPVVEISHVFSDPLVKFFVKCFAGGAGVEGSKGLGRDPELTFSADLQITKQEGDSFSVPTLTRFLDDQKVGHLYLAGQEATACVLETAKGALARKFEVTLLDDAILARKPNKWKMKREELVAHGASVGEGLPSKG